MHRRRLLPDPADVNSFVVFKKRLGPGLPIGRTDWNDVTTVFARTSAGERLDAGGAAFFLGEEEVVRLRTPRGQLPC